jgi:hypothetical protein
MIVPKCCKLGEKYQITKEYATTHRGFMDFMYHHHQDYNDILICLEHQFDMFCSNIERNGFASFMYFFCAYLYNNLNNLKIRQAYITSVICLYNFVVITFVQTLPEILNDKSFLTKFTYLLLDKNLYCLIHLVEVVNIYVRHIQECY